MFKEFMGILILLSIFVSAVMVIITPPVKAGVFTIKGYTITVEKISNTNVCLTDCSLKFRIMVDKDLTITNKSMFKIKFVNFKDAAGLRSSGFRILRNIPYTEQIPIYESQTNYAPYMSDNATCSELGYLDWNETHCRYILEVQSGSREETRYKNEWVDFNPIGKTLKANRWYSIELWGKKKVVFGSNNVDAIPMVLDRELPWGWWNVSISYRQPIYVNQTGTAQLSGFPALLNGSIGLNLASLSSGGKLDANNYCLWFVNNESVDAEEIYWTFSNATSSTHGINSANGNIWANVTIPTTNTSIFMYYDDDCGAAGYTGFMNKTRVYDEGVVSVWWMDEGTGLTVTDVRNSFNLTNDKDYGSDNFTTNSKVGPFTLYKHRVWDTIGPTNCYRSSTLWTSVFPNEGTWELWFAPYDEINSSVAERWMVYKAMASVPEVDTFRVGPTAGVGTIRFELRDLGVIQFITTTTNKWIKDQWYHLVFTWSNIEGQKIWVDGVNEATNSSGVTIPSPGSTTQFGFGSGGGCNYATGGWYDDTSYSNVWRSGDWIRRRWLIDESYASSDREEGYTPPPLSTILFFISNSTTKLFEVNIRTGAVTIDEGGDYAGYGLCYLANGVLGHCSSKVWENGSCSCVEN